ncbi:MAG: hypothetical protein ACYTE6_11165 [Planctomycetota bacterium]
MRRTATRQTAGPPIDAATRRRRRLERLLRLALAYKDCSRKELARVLGRDPTKLVPGTGIPKLDLVVELAGVLDWPVGDVVSYLWNSHAAQVDSDAAGLAASEAPAPSAQQRARACRREALGWRRLGRYLDVVSSATRGLQEAGAAPALRRRLQAILGEAYYALWSLVEARCICRDLLDSYEAQPPQTADDRRTQAFACYVSGQTARRLISVEPHRSKRLAAGARQDLEQALELYRRLALDDDDELLEGRANCCLGALIETDVILGRQRPPEAVARLSGGLDRIRDPSALSGPRLESYGWWCIFGCNIALRHLADERTVQQYMAVFTNKADEIANQLDNWSMRERVFTMQYTRWERAAGSTCFEIPCVIDSDDVRVITGTMGRFPTFRKTGWRILHTAQIVDS